MDRYGAPVDYELRFERTSRQHITCAAGGRSGEYITGSRDGTLRRRPLSTTADSEQPAVTGHDHPVECLAATDTLIASADSAGYVAVWDPEALAQSALTQYHTGPVRAINIGGDDPSVVSGSFDADLVFAAGPEWSQPRRRLTLGWKLVTCSIHPTQPLVAVGGVHPTVEVVGLSTQDDVIRLGGHETAAVAAAFSPTGDRLVTVDYMGHLRIWRTAAWELDALATLDPSGEYPIAVGSDRIYIGTDDGIHIYDFTGTATAHIDTAIGIVDLCLVDGASVVAIPYTGSELVYTRVK